MATVEEFRSAILSLPETAEGSHFHLQTAFRVAGKGFAAVEKDGMHAMCRLDKEQIRQLVDAEPDTFAEAWQTGKYLIGVRFALARVSVEKLRHIVEMAWRTKAPKKLVHKNA